MKRIVIALCLLAALAPFVASSRPDGLEHVANEHGIAAAPPAWAGLALPEPLAAVLGVVAVLALGLLLARWLRRRPA